MLSTQLWRTRTNETIARHSYATITTPYLLRTLRHLATHAHTLSPLLAPACTKVPSSLWRVVLPLTTSPTTMPTTMPTPEQPTSAPMPTATPPTMMMDHARHESFLTRLIHRGLFTHHSACRITRPLCTSHLLRTTQSSPPHRMLRTHTPPPYLPAPHQQHLPLVGAYPSPWHHRLAPPLLHREMEPSRHVGPVLSYRYLTHLPRHGQ